MDGNVLIPRPETELLVDKALLCIKDILNYKRYVNILEIGVGSGAISISIALEIDDILTERKPVSSKSDLSWHLVAVDNSSKALKIAEKNAKNILDSNKLSNIEFIEGDIIPEKDLKFIEEYKKNIDLIISNPPYISKADYQKLPREVRDYEPKASLLAGESGLEVYEKIFSKTKPYIASNLCYIVLETDPKVSGPLSKLTSGQFGSESIEIDKDYNKRDRILTIRV